MITQYKNVPCVVKINGTTHKVEKPKNFFNKHRELNLNQIEIYYIDESISGMKEIAIALRDLEDSLNGIKREQKQTETLRECPFVYRLNCNTIFCAYSQEELDKLLASSKLCNNEKISR